MTAPVLEPHRELEVARRPSIEGIDIAEARDALEHECDVGLSRKHPMSNVSGHSAPSPAHPQEILGEHGGGAGNRIAGGPVSANPSASPSVVATASAAAWWAC